MLKCFPFLNFIITFPLFLLAILPLQGQSVIGGRNERWCKTRNNPNHDDNISYTMTSKSKGLEELQDHWQKKIGKAFFHDRANREAWV